MKREKCRRHFDTKRTNYDNRQMVNVFDTQPKKNFILTLFLHFVNYFVFFSIRIKQYFSFSRRNVHSRLK